MKKIKRHKFISRRDVRRLFFFASEGRKINAAKTTLAFRNGDDEIVAKTIVYEDGDRAIVQWFNHRYYSIPLRYFHDFAKPYRMTLAKYRKLNNNLAK